MTGSIFLITGIIFLGFSLFNSFKYNHTPISKMSTAIFIIAGSTYLFMSCLNSLGNLTPVRLLRYMDWFITVPIMVIQMSYFFSGGSNIKKTIFPLILTFLMLLFGFIGESGFNPEWGMVENGQFLDLKQHEYKIVAGMISIGFMLNLFIQIARYLNPSNLKLFLKILLLWYFYPIVYFLSESSLTLILFSIVDLTAKVGINYILDKELND